MSKLDVSIGYVFSAIPVFLSPLMVSSSFPCPRVELNVMRKLIGLYYSTRNVTAIVLPREPDGNPCCILEEIPSPILRRGKCRGDYCDSTATLSAAIVAYLPLPDDIMSDHVARQV